MKARLIETVLFSAFLICLAIPSSAKQHLEIINSKYLHCDDTIAVFSPGEKHSVKDIPTVFLMHGMNANWRNWPKHNDLQHYADSLGWRIICPDGFRNSWYFNDADPNKMQWRSFFWEECWPLLEKKYGLLADRTFISGLSMGGHGAMNLFLDHPERFKGAGSFSGVLDLRATGGAKIYIPQILGRESLAGCIDQSANHRLEVTDVELLKDKVFVVTCGTEDHLIDCGEEFVSRCHKQGLCCYSMFSPGKHDWKYWSYALPYHLNWFKESLK